MPTNLKKHRKSAPADANVWAAKIVSATTGVSIPRGLVERERRKIAEEKELAAKDEEESKKNPAAVALGRLGGLKGGKARAESLTAKQRSEIARKAVETRWKRQDDIRRLFKKGVTAGEIASKLGIGVEAVMKVKKSFKVTELSVA